MKNLNITLNNILFLFLNFTFAAEHDFIHEPFVRRKRFLKEF